MSRPFAAAMFIKRLKLLLPEGRVVFQPRNRRKTREFMLAEGLNEEDVVDILSRLGPEHYQWGPKDDHDGSGGNVMLFFYPYGEKRLYIKLKILTEKRGDACVVLSLHEEGTYE